MEKSVIRKRIFKIKNYDNIKVLVFCDTHGEEDYNERIIHYAKKNKPALIICAGDFTTMNRRLEDYLHEFNSLNIPFLIIHGNHESQDRIKAVLEETYLKNIVFMHKNLIKFKGFCITGYGGGGFSQRYKELDEYSTILSDDLDTLNCKFKIFISHAPVFNTKLDLLNNMHRGSESLRETLEKIHFNLCICGHFHENEKIIDKVDDTTIINPGREGAIVTVSSDNQIKKIDFL